MTATLECTWILRQPDGYVLYFGVPDGEPHLLPVGAVFETISTAAWTKIRWQVTESIEKHGLSKGEWSQFYRPIKQRELDADEAAVWQQFIEEQT